MQLLPVIMRPYAYRLPGPWVDGGGGYWRATDIIMVGSVMRDGRGREREGR